MAPVHVGRRPIVSQEGGVHTAPVVRTPGAAGAARTTGTGGGAAGAPGAGVVVVLKPRGLAGTAGCPRDPGTGHGARRDCDGEKSPDGVELHRGDGLSSGSFRRTAPLARIIGSARASPSNKSRPRQRASAPYDLRRPSHENLPLTSQTNPWPRLRHEAIAAGVRPRRQGPGLNAAATPAYVPKDRLP